MRRVPQTYSLRAWHRPQPPRSCASLESGGVERSPTASWMARLSPATGTSTSHRRPRNTSCKSEGIIPGVIGSNPVVERGCCGGARLARFRLRCSIDVDQILVHVAQPRGRERGVCTVSEFVSRGNAQREVQVSVCRAARTAESGDRPRAGVRPHFNICLGYDRRS